MGIFNFFKPTPSPDSGTPLGFPGGYPPGEPPHVDRGLVSWIRRIAGGWAGPDEAKGTPADKILEDEKVAAGPKGIILPWFLPYFNEQTGETPAMRQAYRRMWADPNVKSAVLGKILAVAALDLKIQPANKKNPRDQFVAKFCEWNFKERIAGALPQLVWSILGAGLMDGYSVSEKVLGYEEMGQYGGRIVLRALKAKDTGTDLVLTTDEYRNVVGVMGLRYNPGTIFSPSNFVIFRHLPMFESPTGMSDFRAVYSRYWLLDTVLKLRAMGLEKRAIPMMMGHFKNASDKPALDAALAQARSAMWLSAPEDVRIEAIEIAGQADAMFASAVKDLKHDIFLGIQGAILQAIEGTTTDARGNSQVHQDTSDLFKWYLSSALESIFNDREHGLIKDLVDLNFVVSDYPKASLSAIDVNELVLELQIDAGLHQLGLDLDKEEIYERYGRTPPQSPANRLPGTQPSQQSQTVDNKSPHLPEAGKSPFSEFAEEIEKFAAQDWLPHTAETGPNKGKGGWKNLRTGKMVYGAKPGTSKKPPDESSDKAAPEPAPRPALPKYQAGGERKEMPKLKKLGRFAKFTSAARRRMVMHGLRNEAEMAHAVGASNLPDSEPADVVLYTNPAGEIVSDPKLVKGHLARREMAVKLLRTKKWISGEPAGTEALRAAETILSEPLHFFEVKTLHTQNGAGAIRMSTAAVKRKKRWEQRYAGKFHTVAFDDRRGKKASGHRIYYKRGVGSSKIADMQRVENFDDLLERATGGNL